MTKENFLRGAAILGIAGVFIKILGAFYRIPLANMITDEGMGYYQTFYPLYTLLLTISTAGFPTAIAKLVSEKRALGDYRGAHKVFRVSFMGMVLTGILTSAFVLLTAKPISSLVGNTNAYYSLLALTPALLFVPIMSSFRGYFQGMQSMTPTALSQIVEQLFRVVIGLSLAYLLLDRGLALASGGASFGASAGAIAGTLLMVIVYINGKRKIHKDVNNSADYKEEGTGALVRKLLAIAIPITIGAAIVPVMNSIDVIFVMRRLQLIGFTEEQASALYGQLSGMAQTLINLPQVFSLALAVSIVPAISEAFARRNFSRIKDISSSGVRITLLIGLPATMGLYILSTPIIKLLYYKNEMSTLMSTGAILQISAFSIVFLTLIQSLTSILQGLGKAIAPVKNLAVGAVVKIILTYILTGIPSINIRGAAIGTVAAYLVASVLNFRDVQKYTNFRFNYMSTFIKPIISTLIMTAMTWITYTYSSPLLGDKLSTVAAIGVGVLAYGLALLLTGTITSKDFELLPGGSRIAVLLKSLKLLKR